MPRRCAFTIIELIVVLLVMGILAGVAAPRYADSLDHFRGEAAARRIAADLRYAQSLAKRTASTQDVVFDTAGDSYTLPGAAGVDRREPNYTVSLAAEGYPVDLSSAAFGSATTVAFDHRGDPSAAGVVELMSGGQTWTVRVASSGLISIDP